MFEFVFADANTWYTVAFGIVIALGLMEGLGLLVGLSIATLFDNISPIDLDYEVDVNAEITSGGLTQILGWLCLNRLPLMVWLVLFLTCFGILGYTANFTLNSVFNVLIPGFISVPLVLLLALTLTGRIGHRIAKFMPKNESSAIAINTFAGRVAVITLGTAKINSPAEASFTDNFNQKHYVMVEPLQKDQEFAQGHEVVLVQKGPNSWQVTSYQ